MDNNSKKILIIEDDPEAFLPLAQALRKAGYIVSGVAAGEKGLEKFREDKPSLVILDIMLPGMDGWEVLKRIKSGIKSRHVPVLMLTGKDETEDKIKGYDAGADYYITKPYDIKKLLTIIKEMLK